MLHKCQACCRFSASLSGRLRLGAAPAVPGTLCVYSVAELLSALVQTQVIQTQLHLPNLEAGSP